MRPNILMLIMIFMTRFYNSSIRILRINSDSQSFFTVFRLTLIVLAVVIMSSCKKEVLQIGSDLLPQGDFVSINSIDTLSIFSYTMIDDSVRTDHPSTSYLGYMFDPYFGTTTAGFVSQVRLNRQWDSIPLTVDSVKMYLRLLTTKGGGTGIAHSLSIYEIDDQLSTDSAYYSNTHLHLTGVKITNIALPSLRNDTINDIGLLLPGNGIEFGKYLIRKPNMLFYNNNLSDFRSYFKGIYFQLDPSPDPILVSLSLAYNLSTATYYNYVALFGHDSDGVARSYTFILDAKNTNAAYNRFSHKYGTATTGDTLVHRNTNYRDTLSFSQALNGVFTKITLPGLEKLKRDGFLNKIAINKARLVVPIKFTFTGSNYYAKNVPLSLRLRYRVKDGTRYDVPDYSMGSTNDPTHHFFDGTLDSVANVYNFNIPAFVQAYLEDAANKVEPVLEIYEPSGTQNVVLKANKNKTPVKFEFGYTKF